MPSTETVTPKAFWRAFGRGSTYDYETAETQVTELYRIADGATASATVAERAVFVATGKIHVKRILLLADAAVAQHADNHGTITIKRKAAAGDGTTKVVEWTSDTVAGAGQTASALVAYVKTALTPSSNVDLLAGEALSFEETKGGSGVAINAKVFLEWAPIIGQ